MNLQKKQSAFTPTLCQDTQTLWDDDGGLATHPVEHDGDGGGGDGVALTPAGYDEPLELPDGCHHISLSRFLEVREGRFTFSGGAVCVSLESTVEGTPNGFVKLV